MQYPYAGAAHGAPSTPRPGLKFRWEAPRLPCDLGPKGSSRNWFHEDEALETGYEAIYHAGFRHVVSNVRCNAWRMSEMLGFSHLCVAASAPTYSRLWPEAPNDLTKNAGFDHGCNRQSRVKQDKPTNLNTSHGGTTAKLDQS